MTRLRGGDTGPNAPDDDLMRIAEAAGIVGPYRGPSSRQYCECDEFTEPCIIVADSPWCQSHVCPACAGGAQPASEFKAAPIHPVLRHELRDAHLERVLTEWADA